MAEGFLRRLVPEFEVRSAGLCPLGKVDRMAIHVMREVGVDLRGQRSRLVTDADVRWADLVILLAADDEALGALPWTDKWTRWSVEDPLGWPTDIYEDVRDQIKQHVLAMREWSRTRLFEEDDMVLSAEPRPSPRVESAGASVRRAIPVRSARKSVVTQIASAF